MVAVKQLASNKPKEEQAIHFEFYTALPDMQVSKLIVKEEHSETSPPAVSNTIQTIKTKRVTQPEDLERDLAYFIENNKEMRKKS